MKNDREDTFKKLMQHAAPERPSADFTESTMRLVQAEARQAAANETAVQVLLGHPGLVEHPSPDFSRRIMGEVEVLHATKVAPIIPRRTWYLIAASVVLLLVGCSLLATPATTQSAQSGMDILLMSITTQLEIVPIFYPLTIIALSLLMLADYYLRQRIETRLTVMK
ncbi:hypothetical protein [Salmonirosea aquatica]|uniref:Uncharacterized protein n=1 Tax=Salmonirosea aquatica TaxID=2654236 RepID=A0A7C9BDG0_9BACT|nr:hypothetical protein [Cytophagaceae bacterium SJW1-29]